MDKKLAGFALLALLAAAGCRRLDASQEDLNAATAQCWRIYGQRMAYISDDDPKVVFCAGGVSVRFK